MTPKKLILGFALFTVIIYGLIALVVYNAGENAIDKYNEASEKYEKVIGEEFVIRGDTVMVTDYSMIQESFSLSNGTEVNANLIFNKK